MDYIAGTSMGGLVGGFYATGKPADDLKSIVQSADWSLLLAGGTPYQDLSFRRKEDARAVPNTIQIGLKNGPTLPPGLNTGHQVNLFIDRETLPYSELSSFDGLPIPFRCVSTELVSGKPYIFQDGSLSDAHGTGVVIGETCRIGNRVRIYQGVTLGAKSFPLDSHGRPIKGIERHPIVEDDVVIYAGATILGRITIGKGSSIGGNVWLTRSVPASSRITQAEVRQEQFDQGGGI